jgi:glycosyl transferase, family 25
VHAYVINLDRASERRTHIITELSKSKLDYEIVSGVDGRDLDLYDPGIVEQSVRAESWFQPGIVGCALSHLCVYRKMLADGHDQALVLEDDVTLPADLDNLTEALVGQVIGSEVVLLNYDSQEICSMSLEGTVCLPSSRLLVLPIDVGQPKSAAAYLITREACKRMSESVLPVRVQADEWGYFYELGALDRVRCVVPLAIVKSPRFPTTIHHSQTSLKAHLLRTVTRYNVPLLRQAITYRRQYVRREWTRTELVNGPFVEKPSRLG